MSHGTSGRSLAADPPKSAGPVTGSESLGDTVRRLAAAQKPAARGAPAYSRFVNRRIGRLLAAAAHHARLTPNQVTGISAAFTLASVAVIAVAEPTPLTGVLVTLGLLVGYAFDSADGQLARLRGGGSPAGEWLDHVVDSIKVTALHLAVLLCWWQYYRADPVTLLIPLAFALVASVFFFVQILTDQLRRAHPAQAPAPAGAGLGAVARSLLVVPTDYGLLCAVFALLAWPALFVPVYAALGACTALLLIAALPKWFREMSALTPARRA